MSSIYLSTPPDDDAYISFRYAKNIIDGKGFVYNEGERILGTTTPLFTTILTFTGLSGIAIPSLSIVLCSIFLALTGFVLYFFCREEAKKEAGLASALFIILNPWILQSFGNEMILHLLLHLCAFYYFAKQKFMTSWIFAALALLNRGDGIIIAAILLFFSILKKRKIPFKEISFYLLVISPWLIFSTIYFGSPLPSTLQAKIAQGESGLFANFLKFTIDYLLVPLKSYPVLYVFYFFSIIGLATILSRKSKWKPFLIWVLAYFLGYKLLGVSFALRYFIPTTAGLFIMSGKGFDVFISFMSSKITKIISQPKNICKDVLTFIVLILLLLSEINVAYKNNKGEDQESRGIIYTSAGHWLKEKTTPKSTVGLIEIGFIGYFSERKIIDFCGLVTPSLLKNVKRQDFSKGFIKYKPDYFVFNPEFNCWLVDVKDSDWFKKSYQIIGSIPYQPFRWSPLTIFKKKEKTAFNLYRFFDQKQFEIDDNCGRIYGERYIGQSFKCNEDNLCAVALLLATYKKNITCEIEYFLFEQNENFKLIRKNLLGKFLLKDNTWTTFNFEPVQNSKGKTFLFMLRAPSLPIENAITIWLSKDDNSYKSGSCYINGRKKKADLCFRTLNTVID